MTDDDVRRLLAAHGADLDRWPDGLGDAARDRIAASPTLGAAWNREEAFDRRLAGPPLVVDQARVDRLVAAVGRAVRAAPRETFRGLLLGRMRVRTAGALVAALLTLGWLAGSRPETPPPAGGLIAFDPPTLFDGTAR